MSKKNHLQPNKLLLKQKKIPKVWWRSDKLINVLKIARRRRKLQHRKQLLQPKKLRRQLRRKSWPPNKLLLLPKSMLSKLSKKPELMLKLNKLPLRRLQKPKLKLLLNPMLPKRKLLQLPLPASSPTKKPRPHLPKVPRRWPKDTLP